MSNFIWTTFGCRPTRIHVLSVRTTVSSKQSLFLYFFSLNRLSISIQLFFFFKRVELNFDHDDQNCPTESHQQHTKLSNKNWSQTKAHADVAKHAHSDYYDEQYNEQDQYYGNEDDYYYHYYDNNEEADAYTQPPAKPSQHRVDSFDPFEFWTSNPTHETAVSHQAKANKAKQQPPQKETKPAKPSQKSPQATKQSTIAAATTAKPATQQQHSQKQANKPTVACYKKFAVGNYAHMLNEEPAAAADYSNQKKTSAVKPTTSKETSIEEVRANYYLNGKNNKKSYDNDENADFDRIASNVNSHGRQKWKNSTKQTQPSKSFF